MRPMGGLLLTAVAVVSAPCVWAQTTAVSPNASSAAKKATHHVAPLFSAPFAPKAGLAQSSPALSVPAYGLNAVAVRRNPDDAAAIDGPFILPAYTGTSLDQTRLLGPSRAVLGGALAMWSTDEVTLDQSAGGVDSVRMSVGGLARAPGGVITARPDGLLSPDAQAFDVRYVHGWPSALKWSAAGYDVDFSPHAALGVSNAGGTAEAGAMVRFGSDLGSKVAKKLGLHEVDSSTYAGRGRWYLFAAASGQAVGLNMTPGAPGLPRNSWSTETTSAMISDAQAGVGWRKGDMQASFGYVHREIKGEQFEFNGANPSKINDSMVAFSLSIHPH